MPFVNLPGNLRMHYEDDDFTDPWRGAETVILHHGNCKNTSFWYAWVPLLARRFRVIRPDARGFGQSTVPAKGYAWSLQGFADDLVHLMDALQVEKAHLIGETVGGTIGLQFAHQYPERLHSLTTCTSPFRFSGVGMYSEYVKLIQEKGIEAWVRTTADRRLAADDSDPGHREWYIQQMSRTAEHVATETLSVLSKVDMTAMLPQIGVPTAVLVGENSDKAIRGRAEQMAQLLPNSTLLEVPGASGFAQHSAPEACVALWLNYVASLAGGAHAPNGSSQ